MELGGLSRNGRELENSLEMKIILLTLLLASSSLWAGNIREVFLDRETVNTVFVALDEPCSIVFPFPLEDGAVKPGDITHDPEQFPASFYFAYGSGAKAVSVRALKEGKSTLINIVRNDSEVYVIRLQHARAGVNDSVVTFNFDGLAGSSQRAKAGSYHPVQLSAYLERTFLYPLLVKAKSELIDNSEEFGFELAFEFANSTKFDLKSAVKWKDPHPRMIVFNGVLHNHHTHEVRYDRASWKVKIGSENYAAAISQSSGLIEAKGSSPVQIAISENDYPDIGAIDLEKNLIQFAVTFEETRFFEENLILPPRGDLEVEGVK